MHRGVPVFEIREAAGMTDLLVRDPHLGRALARSLGDKPVALMRGHGNVTVGSSSGGDSQSTQFTGSPTRNPKACAALPRFTAISINPWLFAYQSGVPCGTSPNTLAPATRWPFAISSRSAPA